MQIIAQINPLRKSSSTETPYELRCRIILASATLRSCLLNQLDSALDKIYQGLGIRAEVMKAEIEHANALCQSDQIRPDNNPNTPTLNKTEKLAFKAIFPYLLQGLCTFYENGGVKTLVMGRVEDGSAFYLEQKDNAVMLSNEKRELMPVAIKWRDPLPARPVTVPTQHITAPSIPQQPANSQQHPQHPTIKAHYYQQPGYVQQQQAANIQPQHPGNIQQQYPNPVKMQQPCQQYLPVQPQPNTQQPVQAQFLPTGYPPIPQTDYPPTGYPPMPSSKVYPAGYPPGYKPNYPTGE